MPITSLQISSGTFENSNKDAGPQNMVIQFYGQINNQQAPEYIKEYDKRVLQLSNKGSEQAVELINKFNKDLDVDSFVKEYMENKLDLFDLPLDFADQYLTKTPAEPVSIFLMDRLMKAENRGELDEDISYSYQLEGHLVLLKTIIIMHCVNILLNVLPILSILILVKAGWNHMKQQKLFSL